MASHPPSRPRASRGPLFLVALAFLAGLVLMALALARSEWARRTLLPAPVAPAASVVAPVPPVAQPLVPRSADPTPGIDTRVADLEGRIARVDLRAAAAAGNAGRAEALLIAFAARRALDRGVGLGYVEGELRNRFGESQPLAVGAVIAASGAPVTIASLRGGLEAIAPVMERPRPEESWLAATRRTLGSLFVVRRASVESTAPDDRLRRARLMLEGGQVDGAMAEVARLPASAETAAWLTSARRYVEAHRALDTIEAVALSGATPNNGNR